ncbi:GlxA family transcriptional regulator [Glaciecola siphonariae]|uniref:GlxA family transcriptional regulator n=1 Tax=Glaciecola siphonariae TaxID=521012 RepID=A0ABV9LSY0_9ALTE
MTITDIFLPKYCDILRHVDVEIGLYMHQIAVLALPEFVPFDLSIPCEIFAYTSLHNSQALYNVKVCSHAPQVTSKAFSITTNAGLHALETADTVIIPGVENMGQPVSDAVLESIRRAHRRGVRIASICTGAFVLAQTGLLDGLRVTTHWAAGAELAKQYPKVEVDENVLYVDQGQIITSAGAAAGIDMCLHLVRKDYGAAVAANTARILVVPLERAGGQQQFIKHGVDPSSDAMAYILDWIVKHIHTDITVDRLAKQANMSPRTFARKFMQQTGISPMKWINQTRIFRARELLETTDLSMEHISNTVGFNSAVSFRTSFKKHVGTSPSHYQSLYRK